MKDTIGVLLKKIRTDKKLTQSQFAKKLFVSNRTICHYENDSRMPTIDFINKVCQVFDVDIKYFTPAIEVEHKFDNLKVDSDANGKLAINDTKIKSYVTPFQYDKISLSKFGKHFGVYMKNTESGPVFENCDVIDAKGHISPANECVGWVPFDIFGTTIGCDYYNPSQFYLVDSKFMRLTKKVAEPHCIVLHENTFNSVYELIKFYPGDTLKVPTITLLNSHGDEIITYDYNQKFPVNDFDKVQSAFEKGGFAMFEFTETIFHNFAYFFVMILQGVDKFVRNFFKNKEDALHYKNRVIRELKYLAKQCKPYHVIGEKEQLKKVVSIDCNNNVLNQAVMDAEIELLTLLDVPYQII